MEKIRCYSAMKIHLGNTAYLEIEESSDGIWNIKLGRPEAIRIGIEEFNGIHYKFSNEVLRKSAGQEAPNERKL